MTINEKMQFERALWVKFLMLGGDPVIATTMSWGFYEPTED